VSQDLRVHICVYVGKGSAPRDSERPDNRRIHCRPTPVHSETGIPRTYLFRQWYEFRRRKQSIKGVIRTAQFR